MAVGPDDGPGRLPFGFMKPLHPPDQVAPSTARRLLAALADVQVEGRLPSVVAGLVRDGHLVWTAGYGDVPGDPVDTQYKIGSITKTMTAVLVLQLVEERRIRLDSRIGEVLGNVGYADRTVRQLLAHVGGLQAEPDGPWWERSDNGPFDEADHGQVTPAHPVGRTWHYSNLAYGLLGELVARLRGEPWADALRSRVLEPLGMDRTTYDPQAPHAQGFSVHPYARTLLAEPNPDTGWMAPAGQLWSTVTDLATYTRFLLEGHPDVCPSRCWRRRSSRSPGRWPPGSASPMAWASRCSPGARAP